MPHTTALWEEIQAIHFEVKRGWENKEGVLSGFLLTHTFPSVYSLLALDLGDGVAPQDRMQGGQ